MLHVANVTETLSILGQFHLWEEIKVPMPYLVSRGDAWSQTYWFGSKKLFLIQRAVSGHVMRQQQAVATELHIADVAHARTQTFHHS